MNNKQQQATNCLELASRLSQLEPPQYDHNVWRGCALGWAAEWGIAGFRFTSNASMGLPVAKLGNTLDDVQEAFGDGSWNYIFTNCRTPNRQEIGMNELEISISRLHEQAIKLLTPSAPSSIVKKFLSKFRKKDVALVA